MSPLLAYDFSETFLAVREGHEPLVLVLEEIRAMLDQVRDSAGTEAALIRPCDRSRGRPRQQVTLKSRQLYDRADLMIQSSLTEVSPNVVPRRHTQKMPLVATEAGGTSDIIEHDCSGWLVGAA